MKRVLSGILLSAVMTVPALAALKTGEQAPDFTAQASLAGKAFTFSLADALKKGPVVVYFYPSAFTGGCNIEAHTFAENKEKFDAAGASIIGVSQDSIERLNAFSADPQYCAGKIAVASDANGAVVQPDEVGGAGGHEGHARRGHRSRLHRADDVRADAGRQSRGGLLERRRQDQPRRSRRQVARGRAAARRVEDRGVASPAAPSHPAMRPRRGN
jgi:peroxiredoxin